MKQYLVVSITKNIFFVKIFRGFLFIFIFLLSIISSCIGQKECDFRLQPDGKSLLWRISGNGLQHPSFVFGTFHMMCKSDIKLSQQLREAVAASKVLYLELDMDDPAMLMGAMQYMNMTGDKQLKDLYSAEEFERIKSYFSEELHVPLQMFQKAKPYFLVALLYPQMLNCGSPASIEEALVKVAHEQQLEVKGLETIKEQAGIFDSIPYEWQATELLKNIDSLSKYQEEFNNMLADYKSQDLGKLEGMISKSEFGSDKYGDLLINDRNANWVKQLDTLMAEQPIFVGVGAGHLVGDNGLLNMLKERGYTVQPLENISTKNP